MTKREVSEEDKNTARELAKRAVQSIMTEKEFCEMVLEAISQAHQQGIEEGRRLERDKNKEILCEKCLEKILA